MPLCFNTSSAAHRISSFESVTLLSASFASVTAVSAIFTVVTVSEERSSAAIVPSVISEEVIVLVDKDPKPRLDLVLMH